MISQTSGTMRAASGGRRIGMRRCAKGRRKDFERYLRLVPDAPAA